jgi:hypothetical protein
VIELEELLARLAREPSPVMADRLLAQVLATSPSLLGPAQQALDRLRGDAGKARDVEHLQGGWWRVQGGLQRIQEATSAPQAPGPRVLLAGMAGAPGPLWIDPAVPVPAPLLQVAWEAAQLAPLAISRPGRLRVGPYILDLGDGVGGRTVREVELYGVGAPPVLGTLVEVGWGEPAETLGHELVHAMGGTDEQQAARLGALMAGWR